ncbi:MAG: hypothetical protein IJM67_03895, partial [Atopobiaceae bacterium]|nr:hypothetical protein [Atopobiaceae bacterium]
MAHTTATPWKQAPRTPFNAFGILYYPLFRTRADLPHALDDEDMTWAVTANVNLEGTGYTLSQPSVLALAAYHHAMAEHGPGPALNPLVDIQRLVPSVTAAPLYPDFPSQVMEMPEAQFRYDQACHYLSTYGVEQVAGLLGLDVTVGEGWRPSTDVTPKVEGDEALVAPKVLHLLVTVEDLEAVIAARLARATRMHPAEIETALLVLTNRMDEADQSAFPKVAFHENMMELIRHAAQRDSATLERMATGLAQHPGDLLKATRYLLEASPKNHLPTRVKKALCRSFECFDTLSIAHNIADAGRKDRLAPNFLSVERLGGPRLREAVELVESGQVRSWAGELESLWDKVAQAERADDRKVAWQNLLSFYGTRPGILLRSLNRLLKRGCPLDLLAVTTNDHASAYSLPTLVRTLTLFSATDRTKLTSRGWADFVLEDPGDAIDPERQAGFCDILEGLVRRRMCSLDTPLRGRRVFLDPAGVSLRGSLLMPNETGDTGTAWPPVGIAFDLPPDKTVRFFTFWDDRSKRVDIDLHFIGRTVAKEELHVGWNAPFRGNGLVTSGDVTTSHDAVEYLDANMAKARETGVAYVVQQQHIFAGARDWSGVATCYSGALVVGKRQRKARLYNPENLLFRDDLTGKGSSMSYALVNVPDHYVRIMRG